MHESAVGDRFDSNLNGSTRGWKDMRGARRRGLASSSARCPAVHRNWRQKGENDMGVYKICAHKGRARDRCDHAWWGSFHHKGRLHRASLSRWADERIRTKSQAEVILERMKDAVRDGRFEDEPSNVVTFEAFADLYLER